MKKGLKLFSVISVLILSSCVSTGMSENETPLWLRDKDAVYPPDQYLAEVGEGDSLRAAKAEAAAAIARIFRTTVTVDSTIRSRYTEITGQDDELQAVQKQTDFDQSIEQDADESLSNMQFGESWQDEMGRVYTLAYLKRLETGNLYRQRIIENDERVTELLGRADGQENGLKRYAFFDAALVVAETTDVMARQLEIINMPMARSLIQPYDAGELRAARADEAASLRIQIETIGDDEDHIEAALREWVSSKGFSVSSTGEIVLSAELEISDIELKNDYDNLLWSLELTLVDAQGIPVLSLSHTNRSSGISESAALSRGYQNMTDTVWGDFDSAFTAYLNSFLEK